MDQVFDLVVSLEVAEHLPAEFAKRSSIRWHALGRRSLLGRGSFKVGHFNEQWPDYWVDLFRKRICRAGSDTGSRSETRRHRMVVQQNILMFAEQSTWKNARATGRMERHPGLTFHRSSADVHGNGRKHMELSENEIFSAEAESQPGGGGPTEKNRRTLRRRGRPIPRGGGDAV
jgi:hypothetical protein